MRLRSIAADRPSARRRAAHALALTMTCLLTAGCIEDADGGAGGDNLEDGFDRAGMMASLATDVVLAEVGAAQTAAQALAAAVKANCADAATPPTQARQAWTDAIVSWARVEAMRIGPLTEGSLRDAVYAWPITNACAVDQGVNSMLADKESFDISGQLTNRRGLDALEWLLYAPNLQTKCPSQVKLEAWAALDDAGKRQARCDYAIVVADDLVASVTAVKTALEPTSAGGGGGLASYTHAADAGLEAEREALNEMSDALFHIEKVLKDTKLSQLGGFGSNSCDAVSAPCLDDAETPWARIDLLLIRAQLEGFRALFTGHRAHVDGATDGSGFDDWLAHHGADALATQMIADADAAIAAVDTLGDELEAALTGNYQGFVAAYDSTRAVGVNLKSQFLTTLGLDLPASAAGDND